MGLKAFCEELSGQKFQMISYHKLPPDASRCLPMQMINWGNGVTIERKPEGAVLNFLQLENGRGQIKLPLFRKCWPSSATIKLRWRNQRFPKFMMTADLTTLLTQIVGISSRCEL